MYIEGGKDLKLDEAYKIIDMISRYLNKDAKFIWGVGLPDEALGNTIRVLVIITGASLKEYYYPAKEEMEEKEKKKMEEELGIEFVEVEE